VPLSVDRAVHHHRRTDALLAVIRARHNGIRGHSASGRLPGDGWLSLYASSTLAANAQRSPVCPRPARVGPSVLSRERDSATACGAEFVWQQHQRRLRQPRRAGFPPGDTVIGVAGGVTVEVWTDCGPDVVSPPMSLRDNTITANSEERGSREQCPVFRFHAHLDPDADSSRRA